MDAEGILHILKRNQQEELRARFATIARYATFAPRRFTAVFSSFGRSFLKSHLCLVKERMWSRYFELKCLPAASVQYETPLLRCENAGVATLRSSAVETGELVSRSTSSTAALAECSFSSLNDGSELQTWPLRSPLDVFLGFRERGDAVDGRLAVGTRGIAVAPCIRTGLWRYLGSSRRGRVWKLVDEPFSNL